MDYKLIIWTEFKRIFCYATGLRKLAEKNVIPWKKYELLTSIKVEEMIQMINEYYIKLIILDMDGTLKHYKEGLLECNKEWVNQIRDYTNLFILSNANLDYTKEVAEQLDLPFMYYAKKQFSKSFIEVMNLYHVKPENTMVIGDAVIADIYGGKRAGIEKTILLDDMNINRNKINHLIRKY